MGNVMSEIQKKRLLSQLYDLSEMVDFPVLHFNLLRLMLSLILRLEIKVE